MSVRKGFAVCVHCVFAEVVFAVLIQCVLAEGALIVSAEGLGCALCVRSVCVR